MKSSNRTTRISALFVVIGFVVLFTVGLTGCSAREDLREKNDNYDNYNYDNSVSLNTVLIDTTASYRADRLAEIEKECLYVITDDDTGVQYIIYSEFGYRSGAGGITPRYNADGTLHIDPKWNGKTIEE